MLCCSPGLYLGLGNIILFILSNSSLQIAFFESSVSLFLSMLKTSDYN